MPFDFADYYDSAMSRRSPHDEPAEEFLDALHCCRNGHRTRAYFLGRAMGLAREHWREGNMSGLPRLYGEALAAVRDMQTDPPAALVGEFGEARLRAALGATASLVHLWGGDVGPRWANDGVPPALIAYATECERAAWRMAGEMFGFDWHARHGATPLPDSRCRSAGAGRCGRDEMRLHGRVAVRPR